MSNVHVRQIKSELQKTISPHINMDDCTNIKQPSDRESILLTRSLAAYSLMSLTGISPEAAAKTIVDGFDDGGVDSIYFDEESSKLYLIQSKWHNDGRGTIEQGEAAKYVNGVKRIMDKELDSFNDRVKAKESELDRALEDAANTIVLVIVHTGNANLSKHVQSDLDQFIRETNDTSDLISLQVISQNELHKQITYKALNRDIKLEIMLKEWAHIGEPYEAYYGLVEAADIQKWYAIHGPNLFEKNLRKFIGRSGVNNSIVETLLKNPEKFWYLNNGITLLCEKIEKKPLGGPKRQSGIFDCSGVSVVNGAQTVGSIHSAFKKAESDALSIDAKVAVRIISLEAADGEFGSEVTRATNSQNRIEGKDFVSLDPQQERLKTELLIELNRKYQYKTGDLPPSNPEEGCTLEEATAALACAHRDLAFAVLAKGTIGKFWEDTTKSTYKAIFNPTVTGLSLWRTVEFSRLIESELRAYSKKKMKRGRASLIPIHGNRFIAHHVFQTLPADWLNAQSANAETERSFVKKKTGEIISKTEEIYNQHYKAAYPANLFKNQTKSKEFGAKLSALTAAS